jgi:hypothetical protein
MHAAYGRALVGGVVIVAAVVVVWLLDRLWSLPSGPTATVPSHVVIIRHGERDAGQATLNATGRDRSLRLAAWARDVVPQTYTDGRPLAAVYTPLPRDNGTGMASRQTAEPLAFDLGLPLYGTRGARDVDAAARDLVSLPVASRRPVLVVWDHSTVQGLVGALLRQGAASGRRAVVGNPLPTWPDADYATVVVVDLATGTVRRGCQGLLESDAAACRRVRFLTTQSGSSVSG